jgi:hypothetical protein
MFDWPAPFDRPTLEALAGPVRAVLDGEDARPAADA